MTSLKLKVVAAAALVLVAQAASAASCGYGVPALTTGWNAGNSYVAPTTPLATDPGSFVVAGFLFAGDYNTLSCYSFSTTTAFNISGTVDFFGNGNANHAVLYNSSLTSHTDLGGLASFGGGSFAQGDYVLALFADNTGGTALASPLKGGFGGTVTVSAVPEPETYAMMLAGLGAIGFMARRRKS